jgi:hypothetical protein
MSAASPWRLRDSLAAASLFLAAAAFTLWQNARIAVLWDISYFLDSSYRFWLGQLPYKDIPFAHAPFTFLLHAAIIKLFGRVYLPHILCAALESGTATVVTWRILLAILKPLAGHAWTLATLLATTLIFLGIYGVYPHPIYDSDCILAVLIALYLLQRAGNSPEAIATSPEQPATGRTRNLIAGAASVLPLFFKQNIGLPFLLILLVAIAAIALIRRMHRLSILPQLWLCAGAFTALAAALAILQITVGLHNYLYWTITFAAQRRLPGVGLILTTYRETSLLWSLPAALATLALLRIQTLRTRRWPAPTAVLLLTAPFLWTIYALTLTNDPGDRADQFLSLWSYILILAAVLALANLRLSVWKIDPSIGAFLPLILLATIHGAFLSQQLWGSTYAIWPLLLLLIATLLIQIPSIARPVAAIVVATFLLCGGLYATSHERLSYINQDGPLTRSTLPGLRGLTTPGPWLPAFDELVRFTNTAIPAGDGILLLPGEDPFYFATGRTPRFPVLLFDPATDPYTPQQTEEQARAHNIQWLIVNRNLQLNALPEPDLPAVLAALQQDFTLYRSLTNYDIYRRR